MYGSEYYLFDIKEFKEDEKPKKKKFVQFFTVRAHLNDLENILPYLFVGLFYVLTNPSVYVAQTLFFVAAIARIAHSIVYVAAIPQPARGLAWMIHYLITFYMAFAVAMYHK